MKCLICDSESKYFFSKTYTEAPFSDFMIEIGKVDYFKCSRCGFVISDTHRKLDITKWNKLNYQFHHYHENVGVDNEINQPPYAEQAMMISFLGKNGVIDLTSILDYAGGYGRLSNILSAYHGVDVKIFDPYIKLDESDKYVSNEELQIYKTVINSAMFEHILNRDDLEQVNNVVDNEGSLLIHSVICENVPKDPDWFYLRPPVHTAFHTNKSMKILMEQWGYRSSIYSPKSKCWVLLRDNIKSVDKQLLKLNEELQTKWFFYKDGFVDYWK